MQIDFDDLAHKYWLDGEPVDYSVTGVLDEPVGFPVFDGTTEHVAMIDFSHIPEPIRLAAQARGTAVHRAVHFHNEGDLIVEDFLADYPGYAPYFEGWLRFREDAGCALHLCERRVASRRHRFAGTLDCLGWWRGAPCLIDVKTGNPHDVAAAWQLAAYHGALIEMVNDGDAPEFAPYVHAWRYAVQLTKHGRYKVTAYPEQGEYEQFKTLLAAHRGDPPALVVARQIIANHRLRAAA